MFCEQLILAERTNVLTRFARLKARPLLRIRCSQIDSTALKIGLAAMRWSL